MTLFALTAKAFHDPVIILALLTLFAAMVYGFFIAPRLRNGGFGDDRRNRLPRRNPGG